MTLGPIPWTAISQWRSEHDVPDGARFARLIRGMDNELMAIVSKRDDG